MCMSLLMRDGPMSVATLPNWSPNPAATRINSPVVNEPALLSAYNTAGILPQTPLDRWIIQQALACLGQIRHLPADEVYLYNFLGINPVFSNGAEALQLLQSRNIRIEFGDMGFSPAHAQWIKDQNLIMINQKYRGDVSPETIRAIAEAIYHEAGHAKDGDALSSLQEELDCLGLNVMGHRCHAARYPDSLLQASRSRLVADGVALYPKLFFDPDPLKKALINRALLKYGDLPLTSPYHPLPVLMPGQKPIAQAVAEQKSLNNAKTVTGTFSGRAKSAATAFQSVSDLTCGQQLSVLG
jgi:hypothetical protein